MLILRNYFIEENIWKNIFSSLNREDLLVCRLSCKFFHQIISQFTKLQQLLDLAVLKNKVIVSSNVTQSKYWKERLLSSAQKSIEISGNFCGGKIFRYYLGILESKLKKTSEFRVHIISSKILLEREDISAINSLRKQYPQRFFCLITTPKWTSKGQKIENHIKLLVADDQYFMVGGTGFQDNLLSQNPHFKSSHFNGKISASAHQDMDIVGKGPFSQTLRHLFFALLHQLEAEESRGSRLKNHYFYLCGKGGDCTAFDTSEHLIEKVSLAAYTSFPRQKKDQITSAVINLFRQARKDIFIATLGFNPVPIVVSALQARKTNVQATLITNSPMASKSCIRLYGLVSTPYFAYFDKIFLYDNKNTLYHTKVITIDGTTALIGSYNLTYKSGSSTYDIMVRVDDSRVVDHLSRQLQKDINQSEIFQPQGQNYIYQFLGTTITTLFREFL